MGKSNSNSNSNTIVSSNHAVSNNNTSNNNHSSLANQPTNQQTTSHSGGSSDDSSSSDRTRSGSILPRATSWMRTGSSGRRVAFGLARHSSSKSSTTSSSRSSSSSRACGTQPGSQGIRPTHLVMPTPVLLALHQSSSLMRMQTSHGSWLKLTAFLNTTPCSQANGEMVHVMFAWALTSPTF